MHHFRRCASSADTFKCLQGLDVGTLNEVNIQIGGSGFFGTFVFVPVVDGTFIVQRPTQTLQAGRVNGVCAQFETEMPV